MNPNSSFRPEIQGLRAIAVLSVFLFHINALLLPGGFVGVDIFFVISGFLMTKILYKEFISTGSISLGNFYARRIRRLLPASTIVLIAVGLGALFILPYIWWQSTANEILASEFYVQNWFLAKNAIDYWTHNNTIPLLTHYWSLSIEEQYYILWPILFLVIFKTVKPLKKHPTLTFLIIILFLCVCSFSFMLDFKIRKIMLAYFHTGSRIWELCLGGILAVSEFKYNKIPDKFKCPLAWLGLLMILSSFWVITSNMRFPGIITLIPTAGTAFVIIGGQAMQWWAPKTFLGLRGMKYLGDISYSLYLWHWPVIIFAGYIFQKQETEFNIKETIIIAALSLILASLCKIFIEDTFRFKISQRFKSINAPVILLSSLILPLLIVLALTSISANKFKERVLSSIKPLNENTKIDLTIPFDPHLPIYPLLELAKDDRSWLYELDLDKVTSSEPLKYVLGETLDVHFKIAIIGNSHAGNWVPIFERLSEKSKGIQYITFTKSSTQFIGEDYFSNVITENIYDDEVAEKWNHNVLNEIRELKPSLIFVTTNIHFFKDFSEKDINITVNAFLDRWNELTKMGSKVVVIMGTPLMEIDPINALQRTKFSMEVSSPPAEIAFPNINIFSLAQKINTNPEIYFWDFTDFFCIDGACPPVINQVLVYRDQHHITRTYMRLLAPYFADKLRNEFGIETNLFIP